MFKKLILKNYRSYRNQTFDFHPGINGLVGLSQSGKTNVIRALVWLIYNRPGGNRYHSIFSRTNSKTKVSLLLDNDYTISLLKSKAKSEYKIEHPEYGKSEFFKFGQNVPDKISEALNISELNIQDQIDRIFLIASSPSEIAKTINRITKIDDIDKWVKNINSKTNVLKSRKSGIIQDISEIEEKLPKFKGLQNLDKKLSKIHKLTKKLDQLDNEYVLIEDLFVRIESSEIEIKNCKKSLRAKRSIDKILKLQKRKEKLDSEYETIKNYLHVTQILKDAQEKFNNLVKSYANKLKRKKICPTCFNTIGTGDIRRIVNEIHSSK